MPRREKRQKKEKATLLSHRENPALAAPFDTADKPYDLSVEIEKVVARLATIEELNHIRPSALMIAVAQCRNRSYFGTHAVLTALRFAGGKRELVKNKYKYVWPRIVIDGYEMLYLITFYLPRFLDVSFDEKLMTIIHELYHISPRFNGDLRRFPGRNYAHGHSTKEYEKQLAPIMQKALAKYDFSIFDFMTMHFDELQKKYSAIIGNVFKNVRPQRFRI